MANLIHGERLQGVHPDLCRVVRRAVELNSFDFCVIEGLRTKEQEAEYVKSGASTTMNSRHLDGHAVDLGAEPVKGQIDWSWGEYVIIATAMKAAAKLENVPIEWGGDWETFKDGTHFQLPWASYPSNG